MAMKTPAVRDSGNRNRCRLRTVPEADAIPSCANDRGGPVEASQPFEVAIAICRHFANRLHDINRSDVTSGERRVLVEGAVQELEAAIRDLGPRSRFQ